MQVVYFAYRGTLQAQALALVAKKLQASLAVDGELAEEGLASFGDEGDDLLIALARSLTERVEASEDSLEGLFADLRQTEQEVEAALRPDDLAPEEPELVMLAGTMAARQPLDPTEFAELPLFASVTPEEPSRDGARPEPSVDGEQEVPARAVEIAAARRSRKKQPRPTEGEQLPLL